MYSILLKIVNWAVNVCSNLIDGFEVVSISPRPYCYLSETHKGSPIFLSARAEAPV